jgi:hypothetical protein
MRGTRVIVSLPTVLVGALLLACSVVFAIV